MRNTLLWNEDWEFIKEGLKETVTLPHTWNAVDGQTGPDPYYRGTCTYLKTFQDLLWKMVSVAI